MVQAIIMAGGEGSRLRPLTCDRPKPMVPLLNKPVMEYAVELLRQHRIQDIGVTLQYMPQEITGYFGDGSGLGVKMQYFIEEAPLGTAGSVKNTGDFIQDTFIVVSGDALTDFDLTAAIEFHRSKGAMATLVLTRVDIPLEYGVVITRPTGEIRQFLEKPSWGEVFSDTVNTGIYILEPEVLDYIPAGAKFDFSKDLFPFLLQEGKPIFGVTLEGYWCDIGSLKQYQEAHCAAMEGRVMLNLVKTGDQRFLMGESSSVDPSAVITEPVFIGQDCHIGRNAQIGPYAVIGNGCWIGDQASLKRTVVWNGSHIGSHVEIRGAVICEKVTVKNRVMVYEGAVIGDGSTLEEDAKVRPDTYVWPGKLVEQGTVLDSHLIWGTKSCRGLFGADGVTGTVNTNLTPECAAKLGAVFGSLFASEALILIASESHRGTQMIKMALQAGLLSSGVNLFDGGILVGPVHRNAVKALGVQGGVHVKLSSTDPEVVHINFVTAQGSMIPRDMERKMENLFARNDFRRKAKDKVGQVSYMPGLADAYALKLLNFVNVDLIQNRRFTIAAFFMGEDSQHIVTQVLAGLGCEVIHFGTASSGEDLNQMAPAAAAMAKNLAGSPAEMGIVFDSNAEHMILIDERGQVVEDDLYLALMALIALETSVPPVVAVPVSGTRAVEKMAESLQGRVVRTKTASVVFIEEVQKPEITSAQGPLGQSAWAFDALSAIVRLLDFMVQKNLFLSELLTRVPKFHMTAKETDCPWSSKGKVIRQLIEETRDQDVELVDGVKVYHDGGWALVLPDPANPKYRVYSEGFSHEFAESLADFYIEKINQLK